MTTKSNPDSRQDSKPPSDPRTDTVPLKSICWLYDITRQSIARWRRNGMPGVPSKVDGKEPLMQWVAFFEERNKAASASAKESRRREILICEKLEIQIDRERRAYEEEMEGLLVARHVKSAAHRYAGIMRREVEKLANIAPQLAKKNEGEIHKILKVTTRQVLERLSDPSIYTRIEE